MLCPHTHTHTHTHTLTHTHTTTHMHLKCFPFIAYPLGPKKVVESFGGEDVVVIEHQGRTRSSRGKPRGKTERGRGSRGRGLGRRGTAHLGYRGGKRDGLYHPLSSEKLEETFSSSPSDLVSTQVQPVSEEAWDSEDGNPIPVSSVLPSQTALSSLTSPPTTHVSP